VTPEDATAVSVLAIQILTKLAKVSSDQIHSSQIQSVVSKQTKRTKIVNARLASNLCRLQHHRLPAYSLYDPDTARNFGSDVASVCDLDERVTRLWMGSSSLTRRHEAKRHFIRASSQRILGSLQEVIQHQLIEIESAELRAAGEWEVLLAWSLTSCGIDFPSNERSFSSDVVDYDILVRSERWRGVYKASLHGLAPVIALLRFSLNGTGCKPHPFKSIDFALDDEVVDSFAVCERIVSDKPVASSVKKAVAKTLSLLCTYNGDQGWGLSEAIASNILADEKSFLLLKGATGCRFVMRMLWELQDSGGRLRVATIRTPLRALFQTLSVVLVEESRLDEASIDPREYDLSFLRAAIFSDDLRLATAIVGELSFCEVLPPSTPDESLFAIVSCIWRDSSYITDSTRTIFLRTLLVLASNENKSNDSLRHIIASFNNAPEKLLKALVKRDICGDAMKKEGTFVDNFSGTRPMLCSLFAHFLSLNEKSTCFSRPQVVFDLLYASYDDWGLYKRQTRLPVLNLFFLYGARCLKLGDVGMRIVEDLRTNKFLSDKSATVLENFAAFAAFIRELKTPISGDGQDTETADLDAHSSLPTSCSHTKDDDFHDQHWYNCSTCKLVDDKGCCTLCALICHKDHDVSYSRFSSFYCDCGAESARSSEIGRAPCQCLVALSPAEASAVFSKARQSEKRPERPNAGQKSNSESSLSLAARTCALIAQSSFPETLKKSIDLLSHQSTGSDWSVTFFETLKDRFLSYKEAISARPLPTSIRSEAATYDSLQRSLSKRQPVDKTVSLSPRSLIPAICFRPGSFRLKFSSDSSFDSLKRTSRSVIQCDSRARIIIAEAGSLIFCTVLPLAAHSIEPTSSNQSQSRSSLAVLGSTDVEFDITAVKICGSNERHLLVCGDHEAAVWYVVRG